MFEKYRLVFESVPAEDVLAHVIETVRGRVTITAQVWRNIVEDPEQEWITSWPTGESETESTQSPLNEDAATHADQLGEIRPGVLDDWGAGETTQPRAEAYDVTQGRR